LFVYCNTLLINCKPNSSDLTGVTVSEYHIKMLVKTITCEDAPYTMYLPTCYFMKISSILFKNNTNKTDVQHIRHGHPDIYI